MSSAFAGADLRSPKPVPAWMRAPRSNRKKTRVERVSAKRAEPAPKSPTQWPAALFVLVVTFLLYLPTLRFQFVYDDVEQIVHNPKIQSWDYFADYFTSSLWSQGGWFRVRFYRPLFLVWLRINDALFGLHAPYWHLTTIAAHLLATLLVYLLVNRLLRDWVPAMYAALFFGLHPVHVEVAAWISAVSEALLAAALLGSLLCFATSVKRKSRWWMAGALVSYALALLMKETAMVFPPIVFLYAWLWGEPKQRERRSWFAFKQMLPFAGLAAVYLVARWSVLESVVTPGASPGFKTMLLTVPSLLLFYARLLVWPVGLSAFYDTPLLRQISLSKVVVPILVLVAAGCVATGFFWRLWKATDGLRSANSAGRTVVFAWVWIVVFLVPALYLPALLEGAYVQDRYLYLPSVGLSMLLGVGLSRVGRGSRNVLGVPWAQALPVLALAVAMAAGARAESKVWSTNLALFTRAVERDSGNIVVQHNLAAALLDAGRYDEAIVRLRELLRRDRDDPADNNNLGQALLNKGDQAGAEVFLAKSCALHATPWQLYQLGAVRYNLGRADAAEQALRQAIALNPTGAGYHYVLGLALSRENRLDAAKEAFEQELAAHPGDKKTQDELSRLEAFQAAHRQRTP
jgi:Flp pilus assembly protein TadD